MSVAARPRDIEFADSHGANIGQGSLFIDGLPTSYMCTHYRSSRICSVLPLSPTGTNFSQLGRCSVSNALAPYSERRRRFLAPGSRTTRHHYTLKLDIRSRLITSGDTPGGHRDDGSFFIIGEFCQTPNGTRYGIRTRAAGMKILCVYHFTNRACSVFFLRLSLYYSGLLPHAPYPISITCDLMGF